MSELVYSAVMLIANFSFAERPGPGMFALNTLPTSQYPRSRMSELSPVMVQQQHCLRWAPITPCNNTILNIKQWLPTFSTTRQLFRRPLLRRIVSLACLHRRARRSMRPRFEERIMRSQPSKRPVSREPSQRVLLSQAERIR
jgi:hypothetical protein